MILSGFCFEEVTEFITQGDTSRFFNKHNNGESQARTELINHHPLLNWRNLSFNDKYPLVAKRYGDGAMEKFPMSSMFALTVAAGLLYDHTPAVKDMATFTPSSEAYVESLINQPVTLQTGLLALDRPPPPREEESEAYRIRAGIMTKNRVLFQTSRGYVGLGPLISKPGDIICILFGGNVPYVLRPKDGYYQFVGECYIHDIMNGEAVTEWEAKGDAKEIVEFELR